MTGTGERTFSPGAPATRAMLVTILYRLAGEPEMCIRDRYYLLRVLSDGYTISPGEKIVNRVSTLRPGACR